MKEIINKLNENGYEAYIIGGYVRDFLLGLSSKDIDICTNAPIDEIIRIFEGRGKEYNDYFSYHIVEGDYTYDITTYREELEYKKNKPVKIKMIDSFEKDLERRDFTINTFAIDKNWKFVDKLNCKSDLDNKIIRVVGDTDKKLTEDKTRIIRAIRFACTYDFKLDDEIIKFLKSKAHLLNEVPLEFKKKELDLIFDSQNVQLFFNLLKEYKIEKYFNIKFDKVVNTYNKYGIWSQIETTLPLTKEEKKIIEGIRDLVKAGNIYFLDFITFPDDVILNASSILKLDNKVKLFRELRELRSIVDIDLDYENFFLTIPIEKAKSMYKLIERNIIEGNLENNSLSINEFIKENKNE